MRTLGQKTFAARIFRPHTLRVTHQVATITRRSSVGGSNWVAGRYVFESQTVSTLYHKKSVRVPAHAMSDEDLLVWLSVALLELDV